jgi:protein-disulfide isomerase
VLEKFGLLEADYIETGKVRFVVHPYYLGRPETALVAEAAWCAQDQGNFFDFEHIVYENQAKLPFSPDALADLAAQVGLDRAALLQCLSSGTHRADLEKARQDAVNLGVNSTPTFFINNQRITGNQPYPEFQGVIEEELAASQ